MPPTEFNLSSEERDREDRLFAFYAQVIRNIGSTLERANTAPLAHFTLAGFPGYIGLTAPQYLYLGCRYHALREAQNLLPSSFAGAIDWDTFSIAANDLNGNWGDLKTTLADNFVDFNASSYLFGSPIPFRCENIALPLLTAPAVEILVLQKVKQLTALVPEFFTRVQRRFHGEGPPPRLPDPVIPFNVEGLDYFRAAVRERGYLLTERLEVQVPELVLLSGGWVFILKLSRDDPWHYALHMSFVEENRFENYTIANVFRGAMNEQLLDISNEFNGQHLGVKATVDFSAGAVGLSMVGEVPFIAPNDLAAQMPVVINTLFSRSRNFFAMAGSQVVSCQEALKNTRAVPQGRIGLAWKKGTHSNSFEEVVGRELSQHLTGVYGAVFTGFRLPRSGRVDENEELSSKGSEIDADNLLVCEAGVFVIECKNYSLPISGSLSGTWKATGAKRSWDVKPFRPANRDKGYRNPSEQVRDAAFNVKRFLSSKAAATVFVGAIVVFPDNAELRLTNVPVNAFDGDAPAAFNLSNLIDYLQGRIVEAKSGSRLEPTAIDKLISAISSV